MKILSYTIPTAGNKRSLPYGTMKVEHEGKTKTVPFGNIDGLGRNFITFQRKRYYFKNTGGLYDPKFEFDENQE